MIIQFDDNKSDSIDSRKTTMKDDKYDVSCIKREPNLLYCPLPSIDDEDDSFSKGYN